LPGVAAEPVAEEDAAVGLAVKQDAPIGALLLSCPLPLAQKVPGLGSGIGDADQLIRGQPAPGEQVLAQPWPGASHFQNVARLQAHHRIAESKEDGGVALSAFD